MTVLDSSDSENPTHPYPAQPRSRLDDHPCEALTGMPGDQPTPASTGDYDASTYLDTKGWRDGGVYLVLGFEQEGAPDCCDDCVACFNYGNLSRSDSQSANPVSIDGTALAQEKRMNKNRRAFIGATTTGLLGISFIPSKELIGAPIQSTPAEQNNQPTLSDILTVSWPTIVAAYQEPDSFFKQAVYREDIRLRSLGVVVEYLGATYPVDELSTALCWTSKEEREGDIKLAASLGRNALQVHDSALENALQGAQFLVVSKEYHYLLGAMLSLKEEYGCVCKLYTAYARIPRS